MLGGLEGLWDTSPDQHLPHGPLGLLQPGGVLPSSFLAAFPKLGVSAIADPDCLEQGGCWERRRLSP